ncbi:GNAT family N-acetyltransferase [Risungbinella massiliensis]|uniref:GNAT family N-acetyltransferase n=1 Tax=Risungbinella massiliensis TaxID=1329796 RepID=UPI00069C646E|nr:GNAT family N-acetyltransferase [Risungbinella massiliensis]
MKMERIGNDHPDLQTLHHEDRWRMETAYTLPLIREGAEVYVRNVQTDVQLLRAGKHLLPITINVSEYDNSYVCSPYSTYIRYALEELYLLRSRFLQKGLGAVIGSISPLLKKAKIDQNVHLNNWLLSTNLYEPIEREELEHITNCLTEEFSDYALIFRSLNNVTNAEMIHNLLRLDYMMVPSRQVYFFDGRAPAYLRKQNNVWDRKLLEKAPFTIVGHDEIHPDDYLRIKELYDLLYIDKYSPINPQFTTAYIENAHKQKLLQMRGLRDGDGILQGIVGCFIRGDVITVPLVGYETTLPQQMGLYRMLMSIVLQEAAERGQLLHLSSGAANFKRLRGGKPAIEYSAVYARHLPASRKMVWTFLSSLLNKLGAPIMRKYQL